MLSENARPNPLQSFCRSSKRLILQRTYAYETRPYCRKAANTDMLESLADPRLAIRKEQTMKAIHRNYGISLLAVSTLLISGLSTPAAAQPASSIAAGRTVLTFVNRLL